MERNVVALETARRLEEAGWDSPTAFGWSMDTNFKWLLTEGKGVHVAPTAQEIADQIPKGKTLMRSRITNKWSAWDAGSKNDIATTVGDGNTMAEALAEVWLKLREVDR